MVLTPGYACCTFRGSVSALDAATGKLLWRTHTIAETPAVLTKTADGKEVWGPSGAGIWSSPTVDPQARALYVATGDNYSTPATSTSDAVLALDLETGKMLWSKQFTQGDVFNLACVFRRDPSCKDDAGPDFDFGSSPILAPLPGGKRCLILAQKSGMIYAIDPDRRGELLWQAKAGKGGSLGGIQWGPATDGHTILAAVSDLAFLKSPEPTKLAIDPEAGGGLVAYAMDSGREEWKVHPAPCGERRPCSPAQSAAVTAIPGVVFSGSLDGHMRAFDFADFLLGAPHQFIQSSRLGERRKSPLGFRYRAFVRYGQRHCCHRRLAGCGRAGGCVWDGLSGYPIYGGEPGNVLLAFLVE